MTTVLVVDDSASDRRLAGGLLEKNCRWTTVYAADGTEALRQFELHVPDVVLTDLKMPHMDGLQLVNAVKREYPLIPVVLMTAQGSEEIAVQALKEGAASYVAKSQLAKDLVEIMEMVLSAAKEEQSHSRLMHRMTKSEVDFVLENDLSLFPAVVNYLQGIVARLRLCDESSRMRLGVALEEALMNAYYHGNLEISSKLRETDYAGYYNLAKQRSAQSPYRDRRIHLEAVLTPAEAAYVIRDEGAGFDPSDLPDPTEPCNLERPCGRGILLMRTFMDEVRFNDLGNEVTLVQRRGSQN